MGLRSLPVLGMMITPPIGAANATGETTGASVPTTVDNMVTLSSLFI
jgi:hypothetical protein